MSNWKLVDTGGTARDIETFYGFNVMFSPGAGMAPLENISTNFGLLDGALFQRTRVPARSFELVGTMSASTASALHHKRSDLIDALKPDRTASQQPIVIQYYGASNPIQASTFYDGGMEFGQSFSGPNELDMSLRFLMLDPYWEALTSSSAALTTSSTIANANYIIQRNASGMWTSLSSGMNGTVNALYTTRAGRLIAAGSFTTAGGTTALRVAQWTGATWARMGNSFNDSVTSLTEGLDGTMWAAGFFTSVCTATTVNYVSKYNSSTSAWSAASTGMNNDVRGLATQIDGAIIAVGPFSTAGGTSTCTIAQWSSSTWTPLGGASPNDASYPTCMAISPLNGDIYMGGNFLSINGVSSSAIIKYTYSPSSWVSLAGGVQGGVGAPDVFGIALANNGTVFVLGDFYRANQGAVAACRAAQYNGAGWSAMEQGVGEIPLFNAMAYDSTNNQLYVSTGCLLNGTKIPDKMAVWGGTNWAPVGIDLPGNATLSAINIANNVLTLGYNTTGAASAAAVTTINNTGTAVTYPILTACAPTSTSARLTQLVNETTRDAIYFSLDLVAGEEVTLDLRPGKKTLVSNLRGNLISTVHPVSNLATWKLIPGNNTVSFFMSSGSGSARLHWTPRYWSLDG